MKIWIKRKLQQYKIVTLKGRFEQLQILRIKTNAFFWSNKFA